MFHRCMASDTDVIASQGTFTGGGICDGGQQIKSNQIKSKCRILEKFGRHGAHEAGHMGKNL